MSASAASFTFDHQRNFHLFMCHRGPDRARLAIGLALLCCLANPSCAFSQSQDSVPPKSTEASKPAAQKLPRVTTTVVVHGDREENYLPENIVVGSLDAVPLKSAPLSATVVTRAVLNDQVARLLSDVVKNDASVADDYVPVGYYGDYEIRGFPIDLATGIEIDGMTVAGEQDVPLENKESVDILQGLAGVESGVASGGGLIDYVTKPPAVVKDLDIATDQRGTAYGAVDLGRFFGAHNQVGARLNLAGERIQSYLNGADGWRAVGAGAADWKINSNATLKTNFEYQHKIERDGSGYQLLGGTTVPDVNHLYPSTLLGLQPWVKPDTYDVFNTNVRLDYSLPHNWLTFVEGSLSHSLINDNVIYAYGSSFDANGNVSCPNAPDAPAYFFCPDGTYGIYDYRDPGELRIDAVGEAMLTGHVKMGKAAQDLTAGTELFLRSVQQPGFFTVADPYSSDGVVQDGAVYNYVGAENIYQPNVPVELASAEDPHESAGPRRLWENNHQASAVVQDRIHLPGRIQLIAGGRYDSLRDHNYSLSATSPTTPPAFTDKPVWLPQYAVTLNPIQNLTLYSNYGVMLSLGPQAPWWVDDSSQFLGPFNTRQAEIGAKYEPGQRILLSGDLFHMRAPFFYPKVIQSPDSFCPASEFNGPGDLCFESEGHETHNGLEISAQGNAARWLRLTASAMAIRAVSTDTGTPAFDSKQVIDVPHLRATMFADIAWPHMQSLHIMPGWGFASRNEATRDDTVSVPRYNIFNLGASYRPGGEQGRVTFHLYANNIVDKRYWSDTGASYGDTFLWLGAPATVRLSAHYTF
ncbi:MAG: TonB-dependent siderophore receptor [Terracidiphilus sp.]